MLKVAYQLGVEAAVKEAAGEATAGRGLMTVGKEMLGGVKDFFSASKIREALRNIASKPAAAKSMPGFGANLEATQAARTVLEAKGEQGINRTLKYLEEALARDPGAAAHDQLRSALRPYLATAGVGGAALAGPPLAKKIFPGLEGD